MIKNIIFDWSGVINDNVDDFVEHVSEMFEEAGGQKISKNELREKWTQPYMNFYNLYFPEWTLDEQKARYQKNVSKFTTRHIHPGMYDLLSTLRDLNKKIYLITGDSAITLNQELDEYDVRDYFDKIIFDSHDKIDDLKELMTSEKLNIEQTAFVGDTIHEVECSKIAHITSVAVTWGMNSVERLKEARPDHLVGSIDELNRVLIK